jgi:hypothetical protein
MLYGNGGGKVMSYEFLKVFRDDGRIAVKHLVCCAPTHSRCFRKTVTMSAA